LIHALITVRHIYDDMMHYVLL